MKNHGDAKRFLREMLHFYDPDSPSREAGVINNKHFHFARSGRLCLFT